MATRDLGREENLGHESLLACQWKIHVEGEDEQDKAFTGAELVHGPEDSAVSPKSRVESGIRERWVPSSFYVKREKKKSIPFSLKEECFLNLLFLFFPATRRPRHVQQVSPDFSNASYARKLTGAKNLRRDTVQKPSQVRRRDHHLYFLPRVHQHDMNMMRVSLLPLDLYTRVATRPSDIRQCFVLRFLSPFLEHVLLFFFPETTLSSSLIRSTYSYHISLRKRFNDIFYWPVGAQTLISALFWCDSIIFFINP